jgi:hypothetical protein
MIAPVRGVVATSRTSLGSSRDHPSIPRPRLGSAVLISANADGLRSVAAPIFGDEQCRVRGLPRQRVGGLLLTRRGIQIAVGPLADSIIPPRTGDLSDASCHRTVRRPPSYSPAENGPPSDSPVTVITGSRYHEKSGDRRSCRSY